MGSSLTATAVPPRATPSAAHSGRLMSEMAAPAAARTRPPVPQTVALAFAPAPDLPAARAFTWQLAHEHYENFPVVTVLVPAPLRQDFCNIYAFCRIADDLGDEVSDEAESLRLLDRFRTNLQSLYAGNPSTLVFTALADTIQRHQIPIQPFLDLIDAFEQDQRTNRYDTVDRLLDYCRRSADPVGRLVLYLCGCRDDHRQKLSDATCTALQLINFWQDVRRDLLDRNRIYLPRETMEKVGLNEAEIRRGIAQGYCTESFAAALKIEVDRAARLFDTGDALLPLVPEWCRGQISLFSRGGRAIASAIRRQNYDTLGNRPSLSHWQKGRLVITALLHRLVQVTSATRLADPADASDPPASREELP